MVAAGPGRDGLASGVNNAVARIGPLLGIAVFGYWIGGIMRKACPQHLNSHLLQHSIRTF